jgi:hypothetical protein
MIQIDDEYIYENVVLYKILYEKMYTYIQIYFIKDNKIFVKEHNYKHFSIINTKIWKCFDGIKIKDMCYVYNNELFFKWKLEDDVPADVLTNIIEKNRIKNLNEINSWK